MERDESDVKTKKKKAIELSVNTTSIEEANFEGSLPDEDER